MAAQQGGNDVTKQLQIKFCNRPWNVDRGFLF